MTKIKIDECLPIECAELLSQKGHDVATVHQEGLLGDQDSEIWLAAQSEKRFLVTTDLDFSDTRRYRAAAHAGVLLLAQYDISKWEGCLVIATDHKIRIKPLDPHVCVRQDDHSKGSRIS